MDKTKAIEKGQTDFVFDGQIYKTGLTPAKIKKMEKEKQKIAEENNPGLKKK